MADKPVDEVVQVDAALDALSSPTSSDVYEALGPFSDGAVAAVAAKRASGGGGGGSSPLTRAYVRLTAADLTAPGPVLGQPNYGPAVEIVAAPSSSHVLHAVAGVVRYVPGTIGFADGDFGLGVTLGDPYLVTEDEPGYRLLGMPQQTAWQLLTPFAFPLSPAFGSGSPATNIVTNLAGQPLNVWSNDPGSISNPNDADGVADVWVWYINHDLSDLS